MKTKLRIQIPPTLAEELLAASRLDGLPPERIAEQVVENWCACLVLSGDSRCTPRHGLTSLECYAEGFGGGRRCVAIRRIDVG